MKDRLYRYVGPEEIRYQVVGHADRTCISSCADLRAWATKTEPNPRRRDYFPATFIVDDANRLWIADRRSEHVACAAGGCVLAAGDVVISESGKSIEVIEATNQSTGYCPEPECWDVVANCLIRCRKTARLRIDRQRVFLSQKRSQHCEIRVIFRDLAKPGHPVKLHT